MAKTNKPRKRMDRYFKNLQKNSYFLGYNKRGSCTTKIKKWDVIRRLTKKLITEDEKAGKIPKKDSRTLDPGVQLLPRQDVMLYGTIPKVEQRVFSKCKECSRVFNPRDILSHRTCSKSSPSTHPSLLKKKVKSKSGTNKKTSSNSSLNSSSTSNSNSTVVTTSTSPLAKDPIKDFVFKKPYTPPPLTTTVSSSMPQLKVSVTKIGLPKVTKTVTTVIASTSTSTTSSDKSDSRVSSSKATATVHHSSSRSPSSVHHSSKSSSSVHNPRSPSSSVHHSPKSPAPLHHSQKNPSSSSLHHSPRSPSSAAHSPRSPLSVHHSPRSPSKNSSHHGSSHHSSSSSNSSSHHSSKSSSSSKPIPMDTLPPTTSSSSHHHHSSSSTSHSSSSKSSRHKKSSSSSSKRSSSSSSTSSSTSSSNSGNSKVLPKDYDPDAHCGVIEGSRGPCMRSITCSNHRIQLRKLVPGRSKDIHQLIAERKAAKEKDLKHTTTPPCSYTSPNGEAKEILSQNTTFVPIVGKIVSTTIESSVTTSFVPIMPRVSSHQTRQSSTAILAKIINMGDTDKDSSKALTNGYISRAKNIENPQDGVVGTVPVLIMPMSPVSVVSSVQFLKIGNNIISLESPQSAMSPPLKTPSMILPIQTNSCNSIKMYKSHPKPIVLPSFGTRRLGGAILLANPRLESQRNELMTALQCKRETVNNNRGISLLNHSNSPHRPNILKVKGGTKTNCKRPASDKLVTSDSKRLVPDVNGFILHADVSETADAPQSNNCIQEKIALLNMK